MQTVEAGTLKPGDKIMAADDKVLTVKSIGPGLMRGSLLIEWREAVAPPWSCVPKTNVVHLKE